MAARAVLGDDAQGRNGTVNRWRADRVRNRDVTRKRVVASGRVQGVFFPDTTRDQLPRTAVSVLWTRQPSQ